MEDRFFDDLCNLDDCTENRQYEVLYEFYVNREFSWYELGDITKKDRRKLAKFAKSLGIESRSAYDAHKVRVKRHGELRNTPQSDYTKDLLSKVLTDIWENRSQERRDEIRKKIKEKIKFVKRNKTPRNTNIKIAGSKLEMYLLVELVKLKYNIAYKQKHYIRNSLISLSMLMEDIGVAVDILGWKSFSPIWGEKYLERVKKENQEKKELLLQTNFCFIVVKNKHRFIHRIKKRVLKNLLNILEQCPMEKGTYYEIE